MAYTGITRTILKGILGGSVQTRSMFTGDVVLLSTDHDFDVITGYLNTIFAPVTTYISNVWVPTSVEIQHYVDGEYITMEDTPYTYTFEGSGDWMPFLVSVVFVAKAIGKRLIGRKFLPGVTEAAASTNGLVSGAVAAFAAACACYIGTYTTPLGSTYTPGIVDKTGAFHTFSSGILSTLLGTMRRRKPGIGV